MQPKILTNAEIERLIADAQQYGRLWAIRQAYGTDDTPASRMTANAPAPQQGHVLESGL
jgi:hypothetical protein